jgi:hypothetical protein
MSDGNDFFNVLVWPAIEALVRPRHGSVLDTEDEPATLLAREDLVEQCDVAGADVRITGGRRGNDADGWV